MSLYNIKIQSVTDACWCKTNISISMRDGKKKKQTEIDPNSIRIVHIKRKKIFRFRYDENQTKMSNIISMYQLSRFECKCKTATKFSFRLILFVISHWVRTNVSVAVVEYIGVWWVCSLPLFVCLHICLFLLLLWLCYYVFEFHT